MQVHPSALVTGCMVMEDVMGKTSRPIVPKNTVLNDLHIEVLHKFHVNSVEIASKLSDGSPFTLNDEPDQTKETLSFQEQYLNAVKEYKKWFNEWRSGAPIEIHKIRKVMVPLLERSLESKRDVFLLHHYSSVREYPYHHSVAMGLMSGFLAAKMGYKYGDWVQIGLAGLLSDMGMSRIDREIIHKQGPLSEQEYEKIKQHPVYSYRLVEDVPSLSNGAKLAILQHHERLDGSGYPLGMKQDKLHSYSQIIAVCDMYHAMTSERIYRKKQSPFKVLEQILKEQFGHFDYKVTQAFVKEMTDYSTGTNVKLSNNQSAEIVFLEKSQPTRPMVRIHETGDILPLKEYGRIHIDEILD